MRGRALAKVGRGKLGWAFLPLTLLLLAGCGASPSATKGGDTTVTVRPATSTVTPTTVKTTTRAAKAVAAKASVQPYLTYRNSRFSISYPRGWVVSHIPLGGGNIDTSIQPSGGGGLMIRVDENPNPPNVSLRSQLAPVLAALEKQPGYELVGLTNGTFAGTPSLSWEFIVNQDGIRLHKIDTFFVSAGHGWAMLVQAPEAVWSGMQSLLTSYEMTFSSPQVPASLPAVTSPVTTVTAVTTPATTVTAVTTPSASTIPAEGGISWTFQVSPLSTQQVEVDITWTNNGNSTNSLSDCILFVGTSDDYGSGFNYNVSSPDLGPGQSDTTINYVTVTHNDALNEDGALLNGCSSDGS
jgi:hypothetical protein